MITLQIHENTD